MTQDSSGDIDLTDFDETEFDIDEADLEIDEDVTELDNRGLVECRRFVGERRKGQDPGYSGPSRRMIPDRRKSLHDRRQRDDEDNDE